MSPLLEPAASPVDLFRGHFFESFLKVLGNCYTCERPNLTWRFIRNSKETIKTSLKMHPEHVVGFSSGSVPLGKLIMVD